MSVLLCKLPPYNTAQSTANTKQGGAAMASEGEKITNVKIINSLSNLQDRLNFYSTWAPTHEQDIAQMEYRSPFYAAETLAGQCPGGAVREGLLVLDVACGTGLVADEMFLFGFRKFHGIDACQQMMDVAQRKGLFQKLILGMLGTGTAPLESGVYDVAVAVGALQGGGVPWTALTEILQSLKPGGLLCFTLRGDSSGYREQSLSHLQPYLDRGLLEAVTEQQVAKMQRPLWQEEWEDKYIPGLVCIYRKLPRQADTVTD
ncbi:MET27 protein, partial [Amia calva]|nr:MET27 protein [Amia calva]